jgi:hypothetical protein
MNFGGFSFEHNTHVFLHALVHVDIRSFPMVDLVSTFEPTNLVLVLRIC